MRAVVPVEEGEALTVAYINLFEPRKVRAQFLATTKHFTCACKRCSAPLASNPDRFLEVRCVISLFMQNLLFMHAGSLSRTFLTPGALDLTRLAFSALLIFTVQKQQGETWDFHFILMSILKRNDACRAYNAHRLAVRVSCWRSVPATV